MIVLAIIIAAITLFLLLRFGVTITYGQDGLEVKLIVGVIPIKIYPSDKKPKKDEKIAEKLIDRFLRRKKDEKKPGKLETFLELLKQGKNVLNRVRKKLLIKKLDIHFVSAGSDPMQAALMYGSANAVYGALEPMLSRNFRLRRLNFTSEADFEKTKPLIHVKARFSIAVWELLYIFSALISKPAEKGKKDIHIRKEATENGKISNK